MESLTSYLYPFVSKTFRAQTCLNCDDRWKVLTFNSSDGTLTFADSFFLHTKLQFSRKERGKRMEYRGDPRLKNGAQCDSNVMEEFQPFRHLYSNRDYGAFCFLQNSLCSKLLLLCRYCEADIPASELSEHEGICGDREEKCPQCGEWLSVRDWPHHLSTRHGMVVQRSPNRQRREGSVRPTSQMQGRNLLRKKTYFKLDHSLHLQLPN